MRWSASLARRFFVLVGGVVAVAGLAACAAGGTRSVPAAPPDRQPALAHAKLVITIPTGKTTSSGARLPRYLSPATASIAIVFTPTGSTPGGPQTFNASLTPSSSGCVSSLASTVCTLNIALSFGTYVGSFTTDDASGNALSSATNVAVTIVAGQANTIQATLGALPASYAIASYPGSYGATTQSVVEPVWPSSRFIVNALDVDGNVIVGPGAPTYALALSGHSAPNPLALVQPTTTAPNAFSITASSFDGVAQTLTLTATLAGGASCGGSVACSATFTVEPQEIVAMDSYQPAGSILFIAYPDMRLQLGVLAASTTAQGLVSDASGNIYFFDANSKLAMSAYPYTSSSDLPLGLVDPTAVRLTYDAGSGDIDVSDPSGFLATVPPYSGSSSPVSDVPNIVFGANPQHNAFLVANGSGGLFAGSTSSFSGYGNDSFDAIYCPTGFGAGASHDALLMTYNGAGNASIAVEFVSPASGGFVQAFPAGSAIAQQAYQIACDSSGNVTVYYNGALNFFAPNATSPFLSVPASLPYAQPYGLTADAIGNVFYAQPQGLMAVNPASAASTSQAALSFTPGNITVVP
ncbi:MAG TPA: hypothetical protein VMD91_19060 [Candidatus Sulfotelmatobacter sp.]|nr:hypothetical protein [Candidatus Sulfotelmatobacter sp.]